MIFREEQYKIAGRKQKIFSSYNYKGTINVENISKDTSYFSRFFKLYFYVKGHSGNGFLCKSVPKIEWKGILHLNVFFKNVYSKVKNLKQRTDVWALLLYQIDVEQTHKTKDISKREYYCRLKRKTQSVW